MAGARIIGHWLRAAGLTALAVALLWLSAQFIFHLRLLNVQTGSMRPTFAAGDALVVRPLHPQSIRPGMIVSYRSPRNPDELITHRVIAVTAGSFQTKGDALSLPDPAVKKSLAFGQVLLVLPSFGRALGWLQTWPGLATCVYLPATAIALQEINRLNRSVRLRPYRLRRGVL